MKADPSKLVDSEGEALSFNKVDTALKSVGISIKDASGQFRDFDDVIDDLAGKWNSLDKNTQRYIATVMAGNRQQSRFLALVSNGTRLTELEEVANNAEDTAALQVLKTMDSIEGKTTQLKTALQEIYTQAGLEKFFKDVLTVVTNIVNYVKNLTKINWAVGLGTVIQMFTTIGTLLKTLKTRIEKTFTSSNISEPTRKGAEEGVNKSINSFQRFLNYIKSTFAPQLRSELQQAAIIQPKVATSGTANEKEGAQQSQQASGTAGQAATVVLSGEKAQDSSQNASSAPKKALNEAGDDINNAGHKAAGNIEESGQNMATETKRTTSHLRGFGMALAVAGSAFQLWAASMDQSTTDAKKKSQRMSGLGGIASAVGTGFMIGGIPGIIAGIISAIPSIITVIQGFLPKTKEEEVSDLKTAKTNADNAALTSKDELKTLADYKKQYDTLSKTRNKDSESQKKWIDLNNTIAAKYPELIKNMDAEGNYVVDMTEGYKTLAAAKQSAFSKDFFEQIKAEQEALSNSDYLLTTYGGFTLHGNHYTNATGYEDLFNKGTLSTLLEKPIEIDESMDSAVKSAFTDDLDSRLIKLKSIFSDDSTGNGYAQATLLSKYSPGAEGNGFEAWSSRKSNIHIYGTVESAASAAFSNVMTEAAVAFSEYAKKTDATGHGYSLYDAAEEIIDGNLDTWMEEAGFDKKDTKRYNETRELLVESIKSFDSEVYSYMQSSAGILTYGAKLMQDSWKKYHTQYLNSIKSIVDTQYQGNDAQTAALTREMQKEWNAYVTEHRSSGKTMDELYKDFISSQINVDWYTGQIEKYSALGNNRINTLYQNRGNYSVQTFGDALREAGLSPDSVGYQELIDAVTEDATSAKTTYIAALDSMDTSLGSVIDSFRGLQDTIGYEQLSTLSSTIEDIQNSENLALSNKQLLLKQLYNLYRMIGNSNLTVSQKQSAYQVLLNGDWTSLKGVLDIKDNLSDLNLGDKGNFLIKGVDSYLNSLNVNITTAVDDYISSVSTNLETASSALSKAMSGMSLKEANEFAQKMGLRLKDLTFIDGKFYYDGNESIVDTLMQDVAEQQGALNDKVQAATAAASGAGEGKSVEGIKYQSTSVAGTSQGFIDSIKANQNASSSLASRILNDMIGKVAFTEDELSELEKNGQVDSYPDKFFSMSISKSNDKIADDIIDASSSVKDAIENNWSEILNNYLTMQDDEEEFKKYLKEKLGIENEATQTALLEYLHETTSKNEKTIDSLSGDLKSSEWTTLLESGDDQAIEKAIIDVFDTDKQHAKEYLTLIKTYREEWLSAGADGSLWDYVLKRLGEEQEDLDVIKQATAYENAKQQLSSGQFEEFFDSVGFEGDREEAIDRITSGTKEQQLELIEANQDTLGQYASLILDYNSSFLSSLKTGIQSSYSGSTIITLKDDASREAARKIAKDRSDLFTLLDNDNKLIIHKAQSYEDYIKQLEAVQEADSDVYTASEIKSQMSSAWSEYHKNTASAQKALFTSGEITYDSLLEYAQAMRPDIATDGGELDAFIEDTRKNMGLELDKATGSYYIDNLDKYTTWMKDKYAEFADRDDISNETKAEIQAALYSAQTSGKKAVSTLITSLFKSPFSTISESDLTTLVGQFGGEFTDYATLQDDGSWVPNLVKIQEKLKENEALFGDYTSAYATLFDAFSSEVSTIVTHATTGAKTKAEAQSLVDDLNQMYGGDIFSLDTLYSYDSESKAWVLNSGAVFPQLRETITKYWEATGADTEQAQVLLDQLEAAAAQSVDISAYYSATDKVSAGEKLKKQLKTYVASLENSDRTVDEYYEAIIGGGADAVEVMREIVQASSGRDLTSDEIATAYKAEITNLNSALDELDAGLYEGTVVKNQKLVEILQSAGFTVEDNVIQAVPDSVENLLIAYHKIYTEMKNSGEATTAELNAAYAKFLTQRDKGNTNIQSSLTSAFGMTYDTFGEILTAQGKSLEEYLSNPSQYGIETTGFGTINITNWEKYATATFGEITPAVANSKEYLTAFKTYNDSLVEYDSKVSSEISSEVSGLTDFRAGKKFNLTFLDNKVTTEALKDGLSRFGATFQDGILTLTEDYNTVGILSELKKGLIANNQDGQYTEAIKTISDSISSIYSTAISDVSEYTQGMTLSGDTAALVAAKTSLELDEAGQIVIDSVEDYQKAALAIYTQVQEGYENGTTNLANLNTAYVNQIKSQSVQSTATLSALSSGKALDLSSLDTVFTNLGIELDDYLSEEGNVIENTASSFLSRTGYDSYEVDFKNFVKYLEGMGVTLNKASSEYIDAYTAALSNETSKNIPAMAISLIPNLTKVTSSQLGELAKALGTSVEFLENNLFEKQKDGTYKANGQLLSFLETKMGAIPEAYEKAVRSQLESTSSTFISAITSYANKSAHTSSDIHSLQDSYNTYVDSMESLGYSITLGFDEMEEAISRGGAQAVIYAQAIAEASGQQLSASDVSTLYRVEASKYVTALDKITAKPGEIIDATIAGLESVNDKVVQLGTTGQYVVTSAIDLVAAYEELLDKIKNSGEATLSEINKATAKLLEAKSGSTDSAMVSALSNAASMTYTQLGEMLAEQGIELTTDLFEQYSQLGIMEDLGGGKLRVSDFTSFAKAMGWSSDSEQYWSAFKTYNDSMIKLNRDTEKNIVSSIASLSSAKSGDWINVTDLVSQLNDAQLITLNKSLANYGAYIENGILKIENGAGIAEIISSIKTTADNAGILIDSELVQLADTITSVLKNYADLISNGIKGSLTNVQASSLTEWADSYSIKQLDFTETASGLKLSTKSALELYDVLKQIDGIRASAVMDDLVTTLKNDIGSTTSTVFGTLDKIKSLQTELKEKFNGTNTEIEKQISLYQQLANAQSANPDQWKFMDQSLPSNFNSPINYYNGLTTMFSTLKTSQSTGQMAVQDFYNIVNQMNTLAKQSGKTINLFGYELNGDLTSAADLIQKGFSTMKNVDGKGAVITLGNFGLSFAQGATSAEDGVEEGIHTIAETQIKMLDAAINLMRVVVEMEKLEDVDLEGDGIDFSDLFKGFNIDTKKYEFTDEFTDFADNLLNLAKENEEVNKALESVKISGYTMKALLEDATDGYLDSTVDAKAYTAAMKAFYKAATSGDYSIDNIQETIWEELQQAGIGEDVQLAIEFDGMTYILSGGKTLSYELSDELLAELDVTKDEAIEALTKYQANEATTEQITIVQKINGNLTEEDGVWTFTDTNGKTTTGDKATVEEAMYKDYIVSAFGADKDTISVSGNIYSYTVEVNGVTVNKQYNTKTGKDTYVSDIVPGTFSSIEAMAEAEWTRMSGSVTGYETYLYQKYNIHREVDTNFYTTNGKKITDFTDEQKRLIQDLTADDIEVDWSNGVGKCTVKLGEENLEFEIDTDDEANAAEEALSEIQTAAGVDVTLKGNIQSAIEGVNWTSIGEILANAIKNALNGSPNGDNTESGSSNTSGTQNYVNNPSKPKVGDSSGFVLNANGLPPKLASIIEGTSKILPDIKEAIQNTWKEKPKDKETPTVSSTSDSAASQGNADSLAEYTQAITDNGLAAETSTGQITENTTALDTNTEAETNNSAAINSTTSSLDSYNSAIDTQASGTNSATAAISSLVSQLERVSGRSNTASSALNLLATKISGFTNLNPSLTLHVAIQTQATGTGAGNVKGTIAEVRGGKISQRHNDTNAWYSYAKGTLMGELGPELYVAGGRYHVAGANGPEFVDLPKDAIVFNHKQTKGLLTNGSISSHGVPITNERTAISYATGNAPEGVAMASASEALAALLNLRSLWQSLLDSSLSDLAKTAGSGGGGGGGDGTEEEKIAYIKDLDQWYTLMKRIERIEAHINQMSAVRSSLQKDFIANGEKIYQTRRDEAELLATELDNTRVLRQQQKDRLKDRIGAFNDSLFGTLFHVDESGTMAYNDDATLAAVLGENWFNSGDGKYKFASYNYKTTDDGKVIYEDGKALKEATTKEISLSGKGGLATMAALFDQDSELSSVDQLNLLKSIYEKAGRLEEFNKTIATDKEGKKIDTSEENFEQKQVQAFIDKMDQRKDYITSLIKSVDDYGKTEEELLGKIYEIQQAEIDNQKELEGLVLQAIIDMRQKVIDNLQKERDAFSNAADKMVNGLTQQLNNEKQLYNSDESKRELDKLQRQLAILQRTGRSGSEIQSLQDQISSKQKDVYFNDRQQEIDAIKNASDQQLEKMDQQITLLTDTLNYQKENGLLWGQVALILQQTPAEIAQFINDNTQEYLTKSATELAELNRQNLERAQEYDAWRKQMEETMGQKLTATLAEQGAAIMNPTNAKLDDVANKIHEDLIGETEGTILKTLANIDENTKKEEEEGSQTEETPATTTTEATETPETTTTTSSSHHSSHHSSGHRSGGSSGSNSRLVTNAAQDVGRSIVSGAVNAIHTTNLSNSKHKSTYTAQQAVKNRVKPLRFATGGLNTSAGLAWLDGTPQNPEYVLNAEQTKFMQDEILGSKVSLMELVERLEQAWATEDAMGEKVAEFLARAGSERDESVVRSIQESAYQQSEILRTLVEMQQEKQSTEQGAIVIQNASVNMNVGSIANDYDAERAAEAALNKMVTIARKTKNLSVSRR